MDLLDPKSGLFFQPHPSYPPTKTPFLAHFVAKSGSFGRFGGCVAPPHPPPPPLATGLADNFWIEALDIGDDDNDWAAVHRNNYNCTIETQI